MDSKIAKALRLALSTSLISSGMAVAQTSPSGSSSSTPANTDQKSAVFGGTIKHSLSNYDGGAKDITKEIVYPRPGEILFTASKYCGDGDVANYYANNPGEDYAKGAAVVKLAMGYWVAESENAIPNQSNWFAMGFNDLPTNGHTKKTFLANSSNEMMASQVYMSEMSNLFTQLKSSSAKKDFYVYSAAMVCVNYTNGNGVKPKTQTPTASVIASNLISLSNNALAKVSGSKNNNLKVSINIQPTNIQFDVGSGKDIGSSFKNSGQSIESINSNPPHRQKTVTYDCSSTDAKGNVVPATCSRQEDIPYNVGDIRGATKGAVYGARPLVDACKATLKDGGSIKYWWESLPLELTCQTLKPDLVSDWLDQLEMKGQSDSSGNVISEGQINSLKDQISKQLAAAALMDYVQSTLNSDPNLTKNKLACFPATGNYINKVMASLGFPYKAQAANSFKIDSPTEMTHPEPNYALGGYAPYRNDAKAIFMSDAASPMKVTAGKQYNVQTNFTLNFHFHIRDVGCSDGTFFCKNEFPQGKGMLKVN